MKEDIKKIKLETKDLVKELEDVDGKDKEIILASIKGMLLVADVNKEKEKLA